MDTRLNIEGIDVQVDGSGDETILMIHGWPDTARLWEPQVAALRGHWRCARFTLPGFDVALGPRPTSQAQMTALIGAIVDALSPGRPITLLLHDWGCAFGYQYAMEQPARVGRIVGVDIGDAGSAPHVRSLRASQKAGIVAYQGLLALASRLGGRAGDAITRRVARWARAPAPADRIGASMDYPYDVQVTGALGGYRWARRDPQCPLLYLYGRRKPFMFHSPEWLARLQADPRHAVHGFDSGHWPMHERADEFNAVVSDWLARTPPAAG
jgi:pimeloyl-ACP methyl ester carboxylesterase